MTIGLAYARPLLIAGASAPPPNSNLSLSFPPFISPAVDTAKERGIPDPTRLTPLSLALAVYTHLLVLSSSNDQVFWRWGNVFLVQLLWAIEIRLGQHLDDDETAEEVEGGGGGAGGASAGVATSSGGVGGGGEGGGGVMTTTATARSGGSSSSSALSSSTGGIPAPVMVAAADQATSGPSRSLAAGGGTVKWKGE